MTKHNHPVLPPHRGYNSSERAKQKLQCMAPFVLSQLMAKGGELQSGVPPMLREKVFVNLQHDWPSDRFPQLYLNWVPYLYGPVPNVQRPDLPTGGTQSLADFLIESGVCELKSANSSAIDASSRGQSRQNKMLVPKGESWRHRLQAVCGPVELDYLCGLIDLYHEIYRTAGKSASSQHQGSVSVLTQMSACRNRELTYRCVYANVELWRTAIEDALDILWRSYASNEAGSDFEKVLGRAESQKRQVETKLDWYRTLPQTKEYLLQIFKNHPRKWLGDAIVDTFDDVPQIDETPPYPLGRVVQCIKIIDSFTSLLHYVAMRLGLVRDKRPHDKRSRAIAFYLDRLQTHADELGERETMIPKLSSVAEHIESALGDYTQTEVVERRETIITAIRDTFMTLERFIQRLVPDPNAAKNENVIDQLLSNVLTLQSKSLITADVGILFLDIHGFLGISKDVSAETGKSREEVGNEIRTPVEEGLKRLLEQLHIVPESFDPVGGDGWCLTYHNVDALIELACRLQCSPSAIAYGARPKIAIHFGIPGQTHTGASYGRGFVLAYLVTEKSAMVPGAVRLTEAAKARVASDNLARLILPRQTFLAPSMGEQAVYDVDVVRYVI